MFSINYGFCDDTILGSLCRSLCKKPTERRYEVASNTVASIMSLRVTKSHRRFEIVMS
jgi:hypothetical protein